MPSPCGRGDELCRHVCQSWHTDTPVVRQPGITTSARPLPIGHAANEAAVDRVAMDVAAADLKLLFAQYGLALTVAG